MTILESKKGYYTQRGAMDIERRAISKRIVLTPYDSADNWEEISAKAGQALIEQQRAAQDERYRQYMQAGQTGQTAVTDDDSTDGE